MEDSDVVAEGVPDAHVRAIKVVGGFLCEVGDAARMQAVVDGANIVGDEDQATERTLGDQIAELIGGGFIVER